MISISWKALSIIVILLNSLVWMMEVCHSESEKNKVASAN